MMPIGSILGGVLASFGLRTPLYIGGFIATVVALFSIKFFLTLSPELTNSDQR
jgi:hypothetical protein